MAQLDLSMAQLEEEEKNFESMLDSIINASGLEPSKDLSDMPDDLPVKVFDENQVVQEKLLKSASEIAGAPSAFPPRRKKIEIES